MNEMEIIEHGRIPGLTVFFNTVDYRTPHFHPECELIWILRNSLTVGFEGKTVQAEAGELLLFLPNHPHEFRKVTEGCTFLCLQVSPELLGLEADTVLEDVRLNGFLNDEEQRLVHSRLSGIMGAYLGGEPYARLQCLGQACLLFHFLLTHLPVRRLSPEERLTLHTRTERMSSLIRFVDENYMHKLRLSDFAEAEGFSVSYLSHFIRRTLNQSFQEYVNTVRVNCACKLMQDPGRKLTEISGESGFSDYRYFSAAFRKRFGMTPEQYRLSLKKPDSVAVHHSIHSLERFYNEEQSKALLAALPE